MITILSGDVAPTSTVIDALAGTQYVYASSGTVVLYVKNDDGPSSNWSLFGVGTFASDYTPAVSSNWANPNPNTISDALDRLAAKVSASGSSPV